MALQVHQVKYFISIGIQRMCDWKNPFRELIYDVE